MLNVGAVNFVVFTMCSDKSYKKSAYSEFYDNY